jgi:hypothetical protein
MASEARRSSGAGSRDPLDRHASLAMTEAELFTRKPYSSSETVHAGTLRSITPRAIDNVPQRLAALEREDLLDDITRDRVGR